MKVLGLDIGRKRVGVALSSSGLLARPVGRWSLFPWPVFLSKLKKLIEKEEIEIVVIGLTPSSNWSLAVRKKLTESLTCPIEWIDESHTTKEAKSRSGLKDHADEVAAQLIVERYLEEMVK